MARSQTFARGTWIQAEEYAYPNGGQTRRGRAVFPDGRVRAVYAGIADTFYTIPAHARIGRRYVAGHLSITDDPSRTIAHDTADRDACYLAFTLDARYQTPPEPTAEDRAAAAANEAY